MQTDVLHAGMSFFMPNMKGKQTMSKMKATDKQAMEILKKLDELIDFSVDLETNLDESETIEEVLLCLEDTMPNNIGVLLLRMVLSAEGF